MQVFKRIQNPWMQNGIAGATNAPTPLQAPGEIGCAFNDQNTGCSYVRVFLDSGATSAAGGGAVKAGQLAFWKDRVNGIVTNDPNFNDTGTPANSVNRVAGVFQTAVTAAPGVTGSDGRPLQYACDLLIEGRNVAGLLALQGSAGLGIQGAQLVADTVSHIASGGGFVGLASVTTAPTQQVLGINKSGGVTATAANVAWGTFTADITIGFVG